MSRLRRAGLVALLVVVCLFSLLVLVAVSLPWWAILFGALFWVQVARWRLRRAAGDVGPLDPGAARFSPIRGGGY